MEKILISVFDTEESAFEGVSALQDLHQRGDITLYASAVIAKDGDGRVAIRKAADRGPVGTLLGMVTGSLVGLLGGPVGLAVGAYVGATGGLLFDLFSAGFGLDVVDEAGAALTPGKVAVVADVDETWVTPVETRLGALGGHTVRRVRDDEYAEQVTREVEADKAEIARLNAELRQAPAAAKAKLESAIATQGRKLRALDERIGKALADQEAELAARLSTLREQLVKAHEDHKERITARMADLKASHEARRAKLQHARQLANEALELTREAVLP